MFHSRAFFLSWLVGFTAAKDIHLDWNITWVWAAPDGFGRPMIGINDEWPCPLVNADLGDRLIVDVYNGLGNQSTGIHWHGFHQYMTGTMDGANQVTQCALPPGSSMRYEFNVSPRLAKMLTVYSRERSTKPVLIGITRTKWASIPTDSGAH